MCFVEAVVIKSPELPALNWYRVSDMRMLIEHVTCLLFMACLVCLSGCVDVQERVVVKTDGSLTIKAITKVDPEYESIVLPMLRAELKRKTPAGARVDYSQRVDGKAAVIIDAEGAAAAELLEQDGSTKISVSDGGFMKKQFAYQRSVTRTVDMPFPHRIVVSLPGSIQSVTAGERKSSDTVEFDLTNAKRGDVFHVTSTAFAFNLGGGGSSMNSGGSLSASALAKPISIGSIAVGIVLLIVGWARSREGLSAGVAESIASKSGPIAGHDNLVAQAATVFCTDCGAPNAADGKFCSQCGCVLGAT